MKVIEKGVVGVKGQIVIPAKLRKKLKVKPGTVVVFIEDEQKVIIQPLTEDFIESLPDKVLTKEEQKQLWEEFKKYKVLEKKLEK